MSLDAELEQALDFLCRKYGTKRPTIRKEPLAKIRSDVHPKAEAYTTQIIVESARDGSRSFKPLIVMPSDVPDKVVLNCLFHEFQHSRELWDEESAKRSYKPPPQGRFQVLKWAWRESDEIAKGREDLKEYLEQKSQHITIETRQTAAIKQETGE